MAGTRLGAYEILTLIGSGGMGEVYRARDPRLGREVAIKVLPTGFSTDPDRLHRFEQEARAAAALNHPNILTVHDISSVDGVPYVVSELLEGQTLREKLHDGRVPIRVALAYAVQILSGLAAAHDKAIVHRDLKPENLFVTTDGRLKILDFGLAKLLDPVPAGAGVSMLATRVPQTTPGLVLGTIGYMSPEQVRGHSVDARSDLFSVGAILYEMLSGEQPFRSDSPADTMSAILHSDPRELSVVTAGQVAPGLERTVQHCLEKEPNRRFQSARDLAFDLESLSGIAVSVPVNGQPARSMHRRVAVAAALGIVGGLLAAWMLTRNIAKRPVVTPIVQQVSRVVHEVGFSEWPTWSPDGRMFAFSSNQNGNYDVYLARLGGGQETISLTQNAGDNVQPAFSPDGAQIAFVSTRSSRTPLVKIGNYVGVDFRTYGGDIWITPALGGQARRLAQDGNFPAWHPSGRRLAYVTGSEDKRAIFEVPFSGGSPRPLLAADQSRWEILRVAYSPNGRWLTFETEDQGVMVLPAAGGSPTKLLQGRSHAWAPSGRQLFYVGPDNTATRIEAADLDDGPSGLVVTGTHLAGANTGTLHQLSVAPDGTHLLLADDDESLNLSRLLLSSTGADVAGPEEALTTGRMRDRSPSVSPDGKQILVESNRVSQTELWTLDLGSQKWNRVELPPETSGTVTGCWLKDSRHVAVMTISSSLDTNAFWQVALDGSAMTPLAPPRPGGVAKASGFACAASPDGRSLVVQRLIDRFTQLVLVDLASHREQVLTTSASDKFEAAWSPNGRWVTFSASAGGAANVWRISTSGGKEEQLTTGTDRIRHLFYSPDGRWLYIQPNHRNIYRMAADGGPRALVTRFPDSLSLLIEEPTISPDGRYLVYNRGHGGSSIWMLTLNATSDNFGGR